MPWRHRRSEHYCSTLDAAGPVPPWSAIAIGQPAVGGGGLRTEAAVLNNPAAGFMPTVGKAPSSGVAATGREPHAIPGVTLPLAVILTAHRLPPPLRPARQTAVGFSVISTSNSQVHHELRLADGFVFWCHGHEQQLTLNSLFRIADLAPQRQGGAKLTLRARDGAVEPP